MAVKMRLTRLGDKKSPFYRIVVVDSRKARDGQYVDLIGTYDPLSEPATVKIDAEKAKKWIGNGVQPTDKVRALLVKEGIMEPKKILCEKTQAGAARAQSKSGRRQSGSQSGIKNERVCRISCKTSG